MNKRRFVAWTVRSRGGLARGGLTRALKVLSPTDLSGLVRLATAKRGKVGTDETRRILETNGM